MKEIISLVWICLFVVWLPHSCTKELGDIDDENKCHESEIHQYLHDSSDKIIFGDHPVYKNIEEEPANCTLVSCIQIIFNNEKQSGALQKGTTNNSKFSCGNENELVIINQPLGRGLIISSRCWDELL